ncbi:MAG: enoyl-CoA hydratase/isomerase family protein [Pseudomonadota bacterium]
MSHYASEVIIRKEGNAGRITLNRPQVVNALTYPMALAIFKALKAWAEDDAVHLVILDGVGDRGLCAGGDLRALYDARREGLHFARRFWRDEYELNALIATYPKPYIAMMHGLVMGGGIGLSAHGSHRIVTDGAKLAMPECTVGLVPDVGGSWLLAHAPDDMGLYLGLSGARMGPSDAIQAGFASHYVPAERFHRLAAQLAKAPSAIAVDEIIADAEAPIPPSPMVADAGEIQRIFSAGSVAAIVSDLNTTTAAWAQTARDAMLSASPKALTLAHAMITNARTLQDLRAALVVEYRAVMRLYEDGEFLEGIRAAIIDKDRAPQWQPPRLGEVPGDLASRYLAPLPDNGDLVLPVPI